MQWHDVPQNTDEWMDMRIGRIGGSSIKYIMANFGKAFGNPAHKFALQMAQEQIDHKPHGDDYSNDDFDRGHEYEPVARDKYEETTFSEVSNGGYYTEGPDIGISPDGRVYDDGLIEIKTRKQHIFFDTIRRGKYDPSEKWQLFFNLKVSGREWIDYVEYCPEFIEGKRLFIDRLYAKDIKDEFSMIDTRLAEFRALVEEKKAVIERMG